MSHYLTNETIEALLDPAVADDAEWLEQVCRPIAENVVKMMRGRIDSDTRNDLVAEAMIALWRARGKVRPGSNAFSYLTQTAKRAMNHELRSQRRLDREREIVRQEMEELG